MIYSSYHTFNRVLDDPESHGFTLEDIDKKGGAIWHDDLHPASAMHNIIANDIAQFLDDQASFDTAEYSRCVLYNFDPLITLSDKSPKTAKIEKKLLPLSAKIGCDA